RAVAAPAHPGDPALPVRRADRAAALRARRRARRRHRARRRRRGARRRPEPARRSARRQRGPIVNIPPYVSGHSLLDGKPVLVTAAAGTGIGFAVAKRAIEEGARVMISDVHERRLAEACGSLGVPGVKCNVAVQADVDALWEAAGRELGAIDVLVNNAGL